MPRKKSLALLEQVRGKAHKSYSQAKKILAPNKYLNDQFDKLDKLTEAYIDIERQIGDYYWSERTKRKDDIIDALRASTIEPYSNDKLYRAVGYKFSQDPLCTLGSIKVVGGRFNFGEFDEAIQSFHALYLADSPQTALFEKYPDKSTYTQEEVNALNLISISENERNKFYGLNITESYSNYRISIQLENIIDIRTDKSLQKFLDVINDIPFPEYLNIELKKFDQSPRTSVQTIKQIRDTLYDVNWRLMPSFHNRPSNSQWFGHYCRLAGIQAIIYSSTKCSGYNLAVFPDNLQNSQNSYIKIADEIKYISRNRREMHFKNYSEFKNCEKL